MKKKQMDSDSVDLPAMRVEVKEPVLYNGRQFKLGNYHINVESEVPHVMEAWEGIKNFWKLLNTPIKFSFGWTGVKFNFQD